MKQNLIIRASAGTGKTFSLATRFIRLMLFQKVAPERIVALTFSRAAAQEIYLKLLERLWTAALSETGAAAERRILCAGLDAPDLAQVTAAVTDWSPRAFAALLRRLVDVQHYGTIATLDSFILRIVRSFPLEMGFQNAVDVLDGFGEARAIADARSALLARDDDAAAFIAAYRTVTAGEFVRTCSKILGNALAGWRDFALAHRADGAAWTPAAMRAALGIAERPAPPDLSAIPRSGKANDPRAKFADYVARFSPDDPVFPGTVTGRMACFFAQHREATAYEYDTPTGRHVIVECGREGADAVRAAVKYLADVKFGHQIDVVAAKLALCRMIESEYDASTRRRGLMTFSDFTDCQAVAEDSEDALRLANLQFRFDARIDHWALDEFQDTSELQWKCLRRLVKEAAQPGDRTVMTVGDLKQSIYTWRGGNDAPFTEMMERWGEFRGDCGEIVPNAVSYRYAQHTVDFINRVFGPENVRDSGVLGASCQEAVDRWLAPNCWMTHEADRKDGRAKDGDYVAVVAVAPPAAGAEAPEEERADAADSGGAALKILAPSICALVKDLWREHERVGSTDTLGILVRNNPDGAALAERLRAADLPVVWEGVSGTLDSPVVRAVLELLKLAEHPQDTFAWAVVNVLYPIRARVFPAVTHQETVSQEVAAWLSRLGLARTLREIVSRICAGPQPPDARSVVQLESLVREAVNYEQRTVATAGVGDFADYLAAASGRESSTSPHVIRLLTIHRSKGLTLDHVIVPVLETGARDTIVKPRRGAPLFGEGWALLGVSEDEARLNRKTATAWELAANERVLEQLRLYYVALTRARKSTTVFVCADPHEGKIQFRDLLLKPFAGEASARPCPYGTLVAELGARPPFGRRDAEPAQESADWGRPVGVPRVTHRSPSAAEANHGRGWTARAGSLFEGGRPAAAERGTAAHADFAAVEWIDPDAPKNELERWILSTDWRKAFVRPTAAATLWRERAYERFADGVWETGQFDRVVFADGGATIYDFKTNAKGPQESDADFARRMSETYAGQLAAYRESLAALARLPVESIRTCLLLQATGAAVHPRKAQMLSRPDAQML